LYVRAYCVCARVCVSFVHVNVCVMCTHVHMCCVCVAECVLCVCICVLFVVQSSLCCVCCACVLWVVGHLRLYAMHVVFVRVNLLFV